MRKLWMALVALTLGACQLESVNYDMGDDVYSDYADNSGYDDGSDNNAVDYQTFYDQLSPYGTWVNDPDNGYCWSPNGVGSDFSPYLSGGHWVYSSYGWTWASDFTWGWGPFHYGRWFYGDSYGWRWMPGYDWAPAWVMWGDYGDDYCWAPIGPGAVVSPNYRPGARFWNIVPKRNIAENNLTIRAVREKPGDINDHVNIITDANTYGKSVFFQGPKPDEVEKLSGIKVQRLGVATASKPGATQVQGDKITIYRPSIPAARAAQPSRPNGVSPSNNAGNRQQPINNSYNNSNAASPQRPIQNYNSQPSYSAPRQQPAQRQAPIDRGFIPQNSAPAQMQQPIRQSAPMSMPASWPAPVMSQPAPAMRSAPIHR